MTALLAGLNSAAAALAALALRRRWAERGDSAWPGAALALAAAGAAAFAWAFDPRALPLDWLAFLQEGPQLRAVRALYAEGLHSGPNLLFLSRLLHPEQPFPRLAFLACMNLALAGLNAALFFAVACRVLEDRLAALAFAALFALNPATFNASASELPTQALTLYFLLGTLAVPDLTGRDVPARRRAWALLAALSALAALTRWETSLVGLGALAAAPRPGLSVPAASRFLERARRLPSRKLAVYGGGLLALWILLRQAAYLHSPQLHWIVDGLYPFNPQVLTAPLLLLHLLPFGAAALAAAGLVVSLRRPSSFLALPLTTLTLYKLYYSASSGVFYERLRYASMLMPPFLLLALHGYAALRRALRDRGWDDGGVRAVFALSLLVWLPPGPARPTLADVLSRPLTDPFESRLLLSRDNQTEARALLAAAKASPGCSVATVVFDEDPLPKSPGAARSLLAYYGAGLTEPALEPLPPGPALLAARKAAPPGTGCLLFYRGLDSANPWHPPLPGLDETTPLADWTAPEREYSSTEEYGPLGPVVRRAVWLVP